MANIQTLANRGRNAKPYHVVLSEVATMEAELRKAQRRAAKIEEAQAIARDYELCKRVEEVNDGAPIEDAVKRKRVAYQLLHGCIHIETIEKVIAALMNDPTNPMNDAPEDDEETLRALGLK